MMRDINLRDLARVVLATAALGAGVAIVALLLWALAEVWLLMFAGLIFAVFVRSLITPLAHHTRMPDALAYALVIVLVLLLTVATLLVFIPVFSEGIETLVQDLPQTLGRIGKQLERYEWGRDMLTKMGDTDLSSLTAGTFSRLTGVFSTALGAFSSFVLVILTGLYLAADPATYREGAIGLLPPPFRTRAHLILEAQRRVLTWWLIGRLASMGIVGILTWLALLMLGIPFAATLALLAGVLSFIPNIGPIISAIPAVLIGAGISPVMGLYVLLIYVGVQLVETYFITPVITRRTIDLAPAVALIMQIAFAALYGFLGLLLATPLTVVIMVFIKTIYVQDILGEPVDLP